MKRGLFDTMLRLLCCALVLFPQYALAGSVNIPGFYGTGVTPPPRTQLPVPQQPAATIPGVTLDTNAQQNQLVVNQSQPNVIIDWSSFNIGADAGVNFNQQGNTNWSALNRIWDNNPSMIFGRLTADGKIYLINQNGILFGQGSRVNVNSLVASALNIKDDDFLNNALVFKLDNYQAQSNPHLLSAVSNYGALEAETGGSVLLMAPRVENFGAINAPAGQVALVAGTEIKLLMPEENDSSRSGYYIVINDNFKEPKSTDPDFGRAVNQEGGQLIADGGVVGMHGNNVDQWGIIRAVTAFQNKSGQVELRAANKITTGSNSIIALPVDEATDPDTGLPRTISDTFDIQPVVFIGGLSTSSSNDLRGSTKNAKEIELRGGIVAPAGSVTLRADERIYMESGSGIDVSGVVKDLPVAVVADARLTSVELRDYYDQKDGILQGENITTSATAGASIGDISQALLTGDKTVYERLSGGYVRKVLYHDTATGLDSWQYQTQTGNIDMNVSGGDIIVKQGASLNFSGGLINYTSGLVNATKLLSGTQIYDISNAPDNIRYDNILGTYEKTYERFPVREYYEGLSYGGSSSLQTYVQGYTQGGDAGTLSLTASTIVLDGQLNGGVTRGTYQNAWTVRSSNQTDADFAGALMLSKARGIETPRAGTLNIGNAGIATANNPSSISVAAETEPHKDLTADSPLPAGEATIISAQTLNNADLGRLNLTADLTIATAVDAGLVLQPGGSFSATARRIDHEGSITVHGGAINLYTVQNGTSQLNANGISTGGSYVPLDERIIIGKHSVIDVSGERLDNRLSGTSGNVFVGPGRTNGGSVSLLDETDQGAGVFIQAGAVVDVSGGYSIDQKGRVKGGNAGSLSVQGANIELDGDLRGYALADPNGKLLGGSVTLSSTNVIVAPGSSIPEWYDWSFNGFDAASSDHGAASVSSGMKGMLYLAENRFADTGFTRIIVNSQNDLTIEKDTMIAPSLVRLNNPVGTALIEGQVTSARAVPGRPDLIRLDDAMSYTAGPSAFSANAAKIFAGAPTGGNNYFTGNLGEADHSLALLTIADGAVLQSTPGGSISLSGPNVTMHGRLDAPAGTISLTADKGNGDLLLGDGASITAAGYLRPDPSSTPKGFPINYQPMNGGNVFLTASGSLTMDPDAIVDVSGSDLVQNTVLSNGTFITYTTASNPGGVSLSYGTTLDAKVSLIADRAELGGLQGGSLAIVKTDATSGMDVSMLELRAAGFDDLTFRSANSLIFSLGINNAVIGRKLTLDAPIIRGAGTSVDFSAPWIVIENTSNTSPQALTSSTPPATGSFSLSGGWTDLSGVQHSGFIDVIGDVQLTGFNTVTLRTDRDIRVSQALYDNNFTSGKDGDPGTVKNGILATTGNLVLDADRIYPGNYYSFDRTHGSRLYPDLYSDYTIHSGGKMTLQHTVRNADSAADAPIYSAGGSLTMEGLAGIDAENGVTLAAPLGAITLSAPGKRIYLAEGSRLTTAGSAEVMYGLIDANNLWLVEDKSNPGINAGTTSLFTQDSLLQKGVTLTAEEVVARDGSIIDVSGGGSVFAYKFLPGVEGSVDPLTKPGRYIVFNAEVYPMPGAAVYLQGGGGLSAGMYTLLPLDGTHPEYARYAFLPGAHIIEAQPGPALPEQGDMSKDGYPLLVGYSAVADTSIRGAQPQVYTVRPAADVLRREGNYVTPDPFVSGDAGGIKISGNTMILDGRLRAVAEQGFQGGAISLSAANIVVQSASTSRLSDYFNFNTGFDDPAHPELHDLRGGLTVSADGLTGFREVDLGDVNRTNSITIKSTADAPTVMNASIISLAAKEQITLENSASLQAVTDKPGDPGEGVITITAGTLDIESGATLHATNAVSLDANNVAKMNGSLQSDNGALTLKSGAIFFDDGSHTDTGFHLTQTMWNGFTGFQDITLISNSGNNAGIQFSESFNLSAANSLTLDASRIVNMSRNPIDVTLSAATINFKNSVAASTLSPDVTMGSATFTATANNAGGVGAINIGEGDVLFSNFKAINLNSQNDVALVGKGSLSTGQGDLSINAARVIAASTTGTSAVAGSGALETTTITPAAFVVYAGANYHAEQNNPTPTNAITITGNGNQPGQITSQGGTLEFQGTRIDQGGVVEVDGGIVKLSAMGAGLSDGITLRSNSKILAQGTVDAPGGQVVLNSANGGIIMEASSLIDVSARSQGDAGLISLQAPVGGVTIKGDLKGTAQNTLDSGGNVARTGQGGSFALYTDKVGDFAGLNDKLTAGGFSESLDLRSRLGNIDIDSGQTLQAHHVKLTADDATSGNGRIIISGAIEGREGGSVELYAMNDLTIQSGGSIRAFSSESDSLDPNVILSSAQGSINVNGSINVSDAAGNANGTVYLRANRNDSDVKVSLNAGALSGAKAVYVEAVQSYTGSDLDQSWFDQALTYYDTNTVVSRLAASLPGDASLLHLLPGIEVRNAGAIDLQGWDLTTNKYGSANEPGVLTIRATGDLTVNGTLIDTPSYAADGNNSINSLPPGRNSWALNLAAGADINSADPLAVHGTGSGDINLADQALVYTESAPIRFASAGDTSIGTALAPGYMVANSFMGYNLASFSGSIRGNVGRDLTGGGAIQTATGDINLSVGRDLNLLVGNDTNSPGAGAIRTTGRLSTAAASDGMGNHYLDPRVIDPVTGLPLADVTQTDNNGGYYWRYDNGGTITISAGRNAGKFLSGQWTIADNGAWDQFTTIEVTNSSANLSGAYGLFSADYQNGTAGIAAMGGGGLYVRTGGDFLAQTGTFGSGDLAIYANGDIKGRFLNKDGRGEIHAMGNFGAFDQQAQIELFNSEMDVTAQGEIRIGAVLNPSLSSDQLLADGHARDAAFVNCTYTPDTSVSLMAGTDVTIDGTSPYYKYAKTVATLAEKTGTVLPSTVQVDAGGDIVLLNDFYLASSPTGGLGLNAGGDVIGRVMDTSKGSYRSATLLVSDISPGNWYGLFSIGESGNPEQNGHWIGTRKSNLHGLYDPTSNKWFYPAPLHSGDAQPITIHADGDITGLNMMFPKEAEVTAGRDIVDIAYEGQNISAEDVSMIRAGRDISMQYAKASDQNSMLSGLHGLMEGGPGVFMVQAGGSIDLGSLRDGIQEIGNGNNPQLGAEKGRLVILSGYNFDKSASDIEAFFDAIRTAGDTYAKLMADGKLEEAAQLLQTTRQDTIKPLLGEPSGAGDINMTTSQISTSNAASDIFIIANGNMNLGKTSLPSADTVNTTTGITTANGGAINIFGVKDVNVQESRIMTFYSRQDMADPAASYGDITVWSDEGNINAGRGSRTAVSASPPKLKTIDGVARLVFTPPAVGSGLRAMTYGDNAPEPGNIHLFAPTGIIDAGEAGIAGGQITLAALKVTNAANISFSAGSIGMPQATEGATNIGTLAGSSSMAQGGQLTGDVSGMGVSRAQASQMVEDIIAKWLDVKVVDFVEDEEFKEE